MINSVKILLSLLAIVSFVSARPEDIVWGGSSPIVVAIIIAGGIIIVVGIVWAIVYQENERQKKIREFSEMKFRSMCHQYGLSSNEIFELHRMVRSVLKGNPDGVFSSISVFEEAVHKECVAIAKKWGVTSKAENATLAITTIRNKIGYNHLPFEIPLASTRNIEIGQFIAVSLPGTGKVAIEQAVASENSELSFVLKYPVGEEKYSISSLKEVTINLTRNGDGYYTILAEVLDISVAEGKIVLGHTIELDRNQLRKHVRMIVNLPVKCRIVHRVAKGAMPAVGQFVDEPVMIDIGGGGIAFVSEQELDPEDMVSLSFTLSKKTYAIKGVVVAVIPQEGNRGVRYKHRVAFKDTQQNDVESIVKYIFEKQREQLAMLK